MEIKKIILDEVQEPNISLPETLPTLPAEIYKTRLEQLHTKMKELSIETVVIYGDKEHFSNFLYFAGFEPRFEEGILVLHENGDNFVLLGNECFGMYKNMSIDVTPILCQQLSLPNQTMSENTTIIDCLKKAHISSEKNIGIIGWKLFTSDSKEVNDQMFCVPSFIVDGIKEIAGGSQYVRNITHIMISPENGMRLLNTADEIAVFEYGAVLASLSILNMQNNVSVGCSELELADTQTSQGLPLACHPGVCIGDNTLKGLVSPTSNKAKLGDPIALHTALRGGLSNRNGYIVYNEEDLLGSSKDFITKLAQPFYTTVVAWYENIGLDKTGGDIYNLVQSLLPKEEYGWVLNPGHLIAEEEWLSSPVYPGSTVQFKSGMLVQMDIIPSVEGYISSVCEDGICLADEDLRKEIQTKHPSLWNRILERRDYMSKILGIELKPEVLPLSNLAAYYRPYFLNKKLAFRVDK